MRRVEALAVKEHRRTMLVHVEIGDPHLEGQQWGRQQAQEGDAPEREHAATLTPEPPRGRKPPVP
ncbi:MAG TPA: hypothetical protein VLX59_12000, partial [Acidimicrobiales bacterium]|nr:hypothetical protein [Acidimicrobiales bacterium]